MTPTGPSPEHPAILIARRLLDSRLSPPGPAELDLFAEFLRPWFARQIHWIVASGKYDYPGVWGVASLGGLRTIGLSETVRMRDRLLRLCGTSRWPEPRRKANGGHDVCEETYPEEGVTIQ